MRLAPIRRPAGLSLARKARRQCSERGPPRIRGGHLTAAVAHVSVHSAGRAETAAFVLAEGLHRKRESGLGLEQPGEINHSAVVHVGLEVVGPELPLFPPPLGAWDEARVDLGRDRHCVGCEAPAALKRHAHQEGPRDEDRLTVLLDRQRDIIERPGGILEWARKCLPTLDLKAIPGNLGDSDYHAGISCISLARSASSRRGVLPPNVVPSKAFSL